MFSTSRRTPRSQVSSVLPRISTDLTYTVWPVATLRISTLMFRIRLLTFCTQHSAMRSAPSALPISISQPLQARSSCEALSRSMSCAAGARSSRRYMPRLSSSFASSFVIRTIRRATSVPRPSRGRKQAPRLRVARPGARVSVPLLFPTVSARGTRLLSGLRAASERGIGRNGHDPARVIQLRHAVSGEDRLNARAVGVEQPLDSVLPLALAEAHAHRDAKVELDLRVRPERHD